MDRDENWGEKNVGRTIHNRAIQALMPQFIGLTHSHTGTHPIMDMDILSRKLMSGRNCAMLTTDIFIEMLPCETGGLDTRYNEN